MHLKITRYDDMWVTKLWQQGKEPAYVKTFGTSAEVDRYISQIKLVYPNVEVLR